MNYLLSINFPDISQRIIILMKGENIQSLRRFTKQFFFCWSMIRFGPWCVVSNHKLHVDSWAFTVVPISGVTAVLGVINQWWIMAPGLFSVRTFFVDFAHLEIFCEGCFESCANTPIYGQVERHVDHHEQVDQGEDVKVPDLQVPLVVVVASQHRVDSDGLIDVGHDSEIKWNVSRA